MKCSEAIEYYKCGMRKAFLPCSERAENGDCLKHKQGLEKLNKQYGCLVVFIEGRPEK